VCRVCTERRRCSCQQRAARSHRRPKTRLLTLLVCAFVCSRSLTHARARAGASLRNAAWCHEHGVRTCLSQNFGSGMTGAEVRGQRAACLSSQRVTCASQLQMLRALRPSSYREALAQEKSLARMYDEFALQVISGATQVRACVCVRVCLGCVRARIYLVRAARSSTARCRRSALSARRPTSLAAGACWCDDVVTVMNACCVVRVCTHT
jgi:hypothetical protein